MTSSLQQRYRGAMVGVLAGDSLGAPYEQKDAEYIAADIDRRGGLVPFSYDDPWGRSGQFPAGRPTDDSELTAALAQSLIDAGESDPHHQYVLFKRAVNGESFVWDGKADGFGGTTRKMLKAANYGRALLRENRPVVPSNGSLMRSAPLALWYHRNDPSKQDDAVRESSRVTHLHETAVECCVSYASLLDALLCGMNPNDAWIETCNKSSPDLELQSILNQFPDEPEATNVWLGKGGKAGSALHTLHIAIWSLLHATDFRNGLERAIRFAGDTDTQGAVAGSLLGAYYGIDGIPEEWQQVLKGRERMLWLADQLYHVSAIS